MKIKNRLLNILFWSIISAAFIGPGTITTAAKAGAEHGMSLLWALVFSTFTCLLLQEASARITLISGRNLGEAIAVHFKGKASRYLVLFLITGAIILGSAAYETGNLLGAAMGISLVLNLPHYLIILIIGLVAAIVLFFPAIRTLATILGFIVVFMGLSFLTTAIMIKPSFEEVLQGGFIPSFPSGSGLLILGLIGTTVVPYNLFMGSGLADKGQKLKEMRFGLSIAIIFGGIISMAVLIVGTSVQGEFSFEALASALTNRMGPWAWYLFAMGLFAAGLSSAITAPLASAITAKSLFGGEHPAKWIERGRFFRIVWGFVLVVGVLFGLAGLKPIPAIIAAQALNGLILPLITIFLVFVVNDQNFMGKKHLNGWVNNILMAIVVWVTLMLGTSNILKAISHYINMGIVPEDRITTVVSILMLLLTAGIFMRVIALRKRSGNNNQ